MHLMNLKPKLKVTMFVDTEADFYYTVPSPHFNSMDAIKWRMNKIAGRMFRYPWPSRKGFEHLVSAFKSYNQEAIFCVSGHLYLKECDGPYHFGIKQPQNPWYHPIIGKNWYHWDVGGNYKTLPGVYLGDLIEKEKNNKLFKFGLHGFAHEALTLESREVIDSIVKTAKHAAGLVGIKTEWFACPFELTEDEDDPDKVYEILRKHEIKNIFYSGKDKGLQIKRHFSVSPILKEHGMNKFWISNYFEGTSSKDRLKAIMNEIKENKYKEAVYCLGTHDFTHKNGDNVNEIIKFLKSEGFS
ncbi:MAG: hypothetical protein AABW79_05200 [Nanoarchaeota archaeon]